MCESMMCENYCDYCVYLNVCDLFVFNICEQLYIPIDVEQA